MSAAPLRTAAAGPPRWLNSRCTVPIRGSRAHSRVIFLSRSVPPPALTATVSRSGWVPCRRVRSIAAPTPSTPIRPCSNNITPAGVSGTRRLVRSSNLTPSLRSSLPIAVDSGGWAIPRRSAARVKFSSSATVMK